jgi:hypothetical protein
VVKGPKGQLEDFLATHPTWVQKALYNRFDSFSADEQTSWANGLGWLEREVRPEFENIIRQIPAEWNKYRKAQKQLYADIARDLVPKCRPGAPKKDDLAQDVAALRQRGMNFPQIANELRKRGIETTPDAVRKLLKRHSKPDKI